MKQVVVCSVPGDKSISHRALMLSAIAVGESPILNLLESEDVKATRAILSSLNPLDSQSNRSFALRAITPSCYDRRREVNSRYGDPRGDQDSPLGKPHRVVDFSLSAKVLSKSTRFVSGGVVYDCQNSGTTMRLMAGLLCGLNIPATLIGDNSLMQRPMERVVNPLRGMGFDISASGNGRAPIIINATNKPSSTEARLFKMTVPSAQVKSAILLANLFRDGVTEIIEPVKTRDHTEIMLKQFGADISREGDRIILRGGKKLKAVDIEVPGDFSSAAFFIVLATLKPETHIVLKNIGVNPTRTGLIDILKMMGADITLCNQREICGERVADIEAKTAPLHGIEIPQDTIVSAIDEFPILFVAAACAEGKTILRGAAELRKKESDRLKSMSTNLNKLGIQTQLYDDGIDIIGGKLTHGVVDSFGDHRVAMAMHIAKQIAIGTVDVKNDYVIDTSFPDFQNKLSSILFSVSV